MKGSCDTFRFIGPSLARIGARGKQLVPPSVDLSRCAIEFQIELRARLLKDIELVRSRLRGPNGAGYSDCVLGRTSDSRRRRCGHLNLRRSKMTPVMGNSVDSTTKITLRSQTVSPNELP